MTIVTLALFALAILASSVGATRARGDEIFIPSIHKAGGSTSTPTFTPTPTPTSTATATPTPTSTPCVPDCAGKECGPDGCGGSCGTCGWGEECEDGRCVTATQDPVEIPQGFDPDPGLQNIGGVREPAVELPEVFPYDLAGWRYCKNDWCDTPNFKCSLQLPAWHWLVIIAERVEVPNVGSIQDPNGGAALLLMIDRPDQTYRWDHEQAVLSQAGFMATGRVWTMADETHTHEVEAILRDFYLYETGWNMEFVGQCGSSDLCGTITWATVQRWFDGSWRLTGADQWVRE